LKTWKAVSEAKVSRLEGILEKAGPRYQMHNPGTWPKQCKMMYENQWEKLKKYQDALDGGVEVK